MGDVVPLRQLDSITLNPPVARREIARPIRGLDTYNSHPGRGIDPQMIVGIFRAAERGDPVRQFDLFDDMIENDGHLRGLIDTRKQSVSSKPWVLRSGKPGHAPSDRAAVDLEERLRLHLGFRDFLEHQSSAPFYGFAATNIVWDIAGGLVTPTEFINVAHRRFASPSEERAHEIMLITGEVGRMSLTPLQPGLWAMTRYQHRNPWAAGLMRTATWFAYFKRLAHRNWQVFADMFGLPLVIGYYDEGASATTRAALAEACRMIGEDGFAVLSKLGEIVVKENARSGDASSVYPAIADRCDAEQSKLIAGATLNTDVDGKGSYALASVHESRAFEMIGADAERITEMFVRDIGLPFVRFNGYGDDAAPPRLKVQLSRDSLERAKVVQMIGQAIPIDEDQLREEFGLRSPAGGKGVLFPTKSPEGGSGS